METLNLIVIGLIISIVAIYYYRKYIVIEDSIEGFRTQKVLYNNYGAPTKGFKSNTAYITMIADNYLNIYVGRGEKGKDMNWHRSKNNKATLVGSTRSTGRVYHYEVKVDYGDRLLFYSYNWGGSGYFAGHIYWNGKYYPTNKENFAIRGIQDNKNVYKNSGERVGCYKDGGSRRLPYWGGRYYNHEGCRELAQRRNHSLYGLQAGGYCFTGNSLRRAKSYGRLSDNRCTTRGKRNWRTRWTQRLGGSWANDIYRTDKVAKIKYHGNWGNRWYRGPYNRAIYGWCRGSYCARKNWLLLYPGSYGLIPDLGPSSHTLFRWSQWVWEPKEPPAKQRFCPHPSYTEFNPAGCISAESASSCY